MKTTFARWLSVKGLSLESFVEQTGFKHSTASKWLYLKGRKPRELYRKRIREVFPDCPLGKMIVLFLLLGAANIGS